RSIGAAVRLSASSLSLRPPIAQRMRIFTSERRSTGRERALTRPSLRAGHPLPKGEGAATPLPLLRVLLPLASCLLLAACGTNRRTLVITSDPPGALAHVNDVQLRHTPLEANFTWSGVYDVRLSKPGYEPIVTAAEAKPSLHDQPVFDFVSEVAPGTRETVVRWHFTLPPARDDQESLLRRARDARDAMLAPAAE